MRVARGCEFEKFSPLMLSIPKDGDYRDIARQRLRCLTHALNPPTHNFHEAATRERGGVWWFARKGKRKGREGKAKGKGKGMNV